MPREPFTLKLYCDESADGTQNQVFAIGAVIGTEEEWARPVLEWLRATRGLPFHAADCESKFAYDPDPQKHLDNLALYKRVTTVLAESPLVGIAVALDLQATHACLPEVPGDIGYTKCFSDIVRCAGEMAQRFNAQYPDEQVRVQFTFESRRETDGTGRAVYDALSSLPEPSDASVFSPRVAFEPKGNVCLEMADLLAREAMKEFQRKLSASSRPQRRSFQALANASRDGTPKFIWVEHDRAFCEQWRKRVDSVEGHEDRKDYAQWLEANGLSDGQANRARFYNWIEHRDAVKRQNRQSSQASDAPRRR